MTLFRTASALMIVPLLGACALPTDQTARINREQTPPLPQAVLEIAGPNQNLATARLRPEDGCYWYEHNGVVETTLLPLRTVQGNPICVSAAT